MRVPRLRFSTRAACVLLIASMIPSGASALGDSPSGESAPLLRGRHSISLQGGVLSRITAQSDVVDGNVRSEVRDSGSLGWLSYAYWVSREWSVGIDVGVIDAGTRTSVEPGEVTSESAVVTSILFGAAYYPERLAVTPSLRPYGSAAFGSYAGSATNSRVTDGVVNESVSESALGLRLRAGADLFFGGRFKAGFAVGYHFVGDFDEQIGSHRNYSGPEFLVGLGVLFGGER